MTKYVSIMRGMVKYRWNPGENQRIMITIISGTNRQGSNTGKVAAQYLQLLKNKGIDAKFVSLEGMDVNERNAGIQKLEKDILIPTDKFIFIFSPSEICSFLELPNSMANEAEDQLKIRLRFAA